MKYKFNRILPIILILVSIICIYNFLNQETEEDTAFDAISFGSFSDYEIPSKIVDEISFDNDTMIAVYTTMANTIGIAYIDCSDPYEYDVIEKRSMPINGINKNMFLNAHFSEYNAQTVYYSFSSEKTDDNKKYTVELDDNIIYDFYFSYSVSSASKT